jgi:multicomponent Na+:H+ antiporter subunit D
VSAYALAGFKVRELGPLQGAINFAITNTLAAYMILAGIALLYGRTGALNLAQIGRNLAAHPADRLVIVALTLIVGGLLVKAAIVPFHFWLADAHASAPCSRGRCMRTRARSSSCSSGSA